MWRLSLTFVDIALHRRGPDVLPASQFLLGVVLIGYFIVGFGTLQHDTAPGQAVVLLVFDRALYLGSAWLVLNAYDKRQRFLQTAIALVGVDIFLNVVGLPLLLWDDAIGAGPKDMTLPRALSVIVVLWSIDVAGFIIAKAVSRPYIVGLLIVIVYAFLSMALGNALFPPVSQT